MDLASAMMSINAVKGVNIGSGMNSAQLTGEENSDEIISKGKNIKFKSNKAGGILGGISSGQEIIVSFAVKPTSSILSSRKTIRKKYFYICQRASRPMCWNKSSPYW